MNAEISRHKIPIIFIPRNEKWMNGLFFFSSYFAILHQHSKRGWNDNKWEPLEELLAIKGNRDLQYTTPVSPAKLKQITPTSVAYYPANKNDLFIIIILIHLFDHHFSPICMTSITSFPVCKHDKCHELEVKVSKRLREHAEKWFYTVILIGFDLLVKFACLQCW